MPFTQGFSESYCSVHFNITRAAAEIETKDRGLVKDRFIQNKGAKQEEQNQEQLMFTGFLPVTKKPDWGSRCRDGGGSSCYKSRDRQTYREEEGKGRE